MAKKLGVLLTRAFAKFVPTILAASILKLQKPFCGRCSDPLISPQSPFGHQYFKRTAQNSDAQGPGRT